LIAVGTATVVGVGEVNILKKHKKRKEERKQSNIARSKSIIVHGVLPETERYKI